MNWVFLGLFVALVTSLAKCYADIVYPSDAPIWSRGFFKANRHTIGLAVLAILGFTVAWAGVLDNNEQADEEKKALRSYSATLESAVLGDEVIEPTIELVLASYDIDQCDSTSDVHELGNWIDADRDKSPLAIGFIGPIVRNRLFHSSDHPGNQRDLGEVELSLGRSDLRLHFTVRSDGTVVRRSTRVFNIQQAYLALSDDESACSIVLRVKVKETMESVAIFNAIQHAYESNAQILSVRTFTDLARVCKLQLFAGRLSVNLHEGGHLKATGLLRGSNHQSGGDESESTNWMFEESPQLRRSTRGRLQPVHAASTVHD